MKIEIENSEITEIPFKNEQKGTSGVIRKQKAFWFKPGSKYPVPFEFSLGEDDQALLPGEYNVDAELFIDIDRFNSLSVNSYNVYETIKAGHKPASGK